MLRIVTDSSCDLPKELLEKYNISVVPLTVTIDGKEYIEGINITQQEFYKRMFESDKLPKTSQPSPNAFIQAFDGFSKEDEVLCLNISSKLSGTYQSACIGKEMCNNNVTVFDTLAGSLGHGLQILKAAELSALETSKDLIVERLKEYRKEMDILILLDTLDNIVKGGRLSRFKGTIAKMMNIKTILEGVNGEVKLIEKIRGKKKFLNRVIDAIGERKDDFSETVFGITHVNNIKDAEFLKKAIIEKYNPKDVIINYMGSTMATYAGKGGMIVSFL